MSITKTASGLLYADDFNRADEDLVDSVDWEGSLALDLISNEIKTDPLDTSGYELCLLTQAAVSQQGEMVVQCKVLLADNFNFSTPHPGVVVAGDLSRFHSFNLELKMFQNNNPSQFRLWYTVTGLPVIELINDTSLTLAFQTYYDIKLWVKDGFQRIWFDGVVRGTASYTGNDAQVWSPGISRGGSGLVAGTYAKFDDFHSYKSNIVTVTGLKSGYKAKVGTAPAVSEIAGSAAVDIEGQNAPVSTIKVLTSSESLVEELASAAAYGGDTWLYTEPWIQDAVGVGSWAQD